MFESMTLNKKEHLKNMHFGYSKFSEFSVPDSLVTDTNVNAHLSPSGRKILARICLPFSTPDKNQ